MKSYISKQVECRTIDNNRKSMQKVSVASNSIIQFAPRVIMTEDDIKKLSLEQLSFFVSQSIRKELYGITMPWKDEIDFNYNNVQLINALKRIHSLNTVGENIVLYENMVGVTYGKNIIYPGLDSCLGITIGEFYQFNLSSCIRQQNSLTAQFVSFSLSNLANIFYPPQFLQ